MKKKIGIVLPYQNGDLITATSVLRYREELWGDADIVWFCNEPHCDALKYQDVEIRNFPHGWAIPEVDIIGKYAERIQKDFEDGKPAWEDLSLLMTKENRLNHELKHTSKSTKDLDEAYFCAPWMLTVEQRHGIEYPNISKKVFGIPNNYAWHPVLRFSENDYEEAIVFKNKMPRYALTICIESMAGSGQSILSDSMIRNAIEILEERLVNVNFVFVSDKYLKNQQEFPEDILNKENCFFAGHFSVRQCALIVGMSDLLISVSSGITVAASCWENKHIGTVIIQYTGSSICSTQAMAHGKFHLITTDEKPNHVSENEFYDLLKIV